jgi:sugar/nucleoside kinase (ribokinase family)
MKAARSKGVETIINPAPAVSLPEEAYSGLGHLIVNETEASVMSGIENPTSWDKVAAVFIARGVKNVIITLGGEVSIKSLSEPQSATNFNIRVYITKQTSGKRSLNPDSWFQRGKSKLSILQLPVILLSVRIL